jgi:hypothetical protein
MYIQKEFGDITLNQLELMAHTIGFERKSIKYNKYKAYRNYFVTNERTADFKLLKVLESAGLVESKTTDKEIYQGFIFWVTKKGFEVLEKTFECKIEEIE